MAEDAMCVLRRVFGGAIPDPVAVVASKWGSDPYALGAPPRYNVDPACSGAGLWYLLLK